MSTYKLLVLTRALLLTGWLVFGSAARANTGQDDSPVFPLNTADGTPAGSAQADSLAFVLDTRPFWPPFLAGPFADSGVFALDTRGAALTTVTVSSASAPADGQSFVSVTVTLLDTNGQPVSGKTIKVSALGTTMGVAITQPAAPTDMSGQATAMVTSTTPGTVLITATDVTDGIPLSQQGQQPLVTFTASLVAPSAEFSSAIGSARDGVAGVLSPGNSGIAQIAIDEGNIGASFKKKVSSEAARACVDTLFFAGSEAGDAVVTESSALQKLVVSAGETVDNDLVGGAVQTFIEGLAGDASGLIQVGEGIAADCSQKSAALTAQAQSLRNGIPTPSADRAA